MDRMVTDLRLNLQPDPNDARSIYAIPAQPQRGIAACPSVGADISAGPRRGWVYVCYNDRAPGKTHDDVDIFVRRSSNDGITWSDPVRVNDDAGTASQFWPWMSVDPVDGSLNVAFYDCRDDAANKEGERLLRPQPRRRPDLRAERKGDQRGVGSVHRGGRPLR